MCGRPVLCTPSPVQLLGLRWIFFLPTDLELGGSRGALSMLVLDLLTSFLAICRESGILSLASVSPVPM